MARVPGIGGAAGTWVQRRLLTLRPGGGLSYPYPMMDDDPVTVRFFAAARAAAGCDQMTVNPGPLERVIESIHAAFPALAAVTPRCSFLVDALSAKRHEDGPI